MMAKLKARISNLQSRHSPFTIVCSILVFLALVLRLVPLGRYVTPDEPAWVYRSIRFADALAARDWAAIPSTGHPGVTTMWLGALGVTIHRLASPVESAAHLAWIRHLAWLAPENGEAFRHLAPFLPWGRVAVALVTTLGLILLYPLLKRLFDRRVALLIVGLLAFDPFLIGHSGLLHTDALLATFTLLALAAGLNGLQEPRRAVWWALSGLFTGLALLTKTPGVILPPFILFLLAISAFRKSQISNLKSQIAYCSLFIVTLFIVLFALYPALWVDPAGIFDTLFAFAGRHVGMVQRPIFFAGQMTYDPGPAFYPVVFLFRVSPVVLVGLAIGLLALRRLSSERRFAFLLLLAFAVGFGALMSLATKKHDRYLLPALLPLTIAAALGIGTLVDWYTGKLVRPAPDQSTNLPIYQSTNLPIYQSTIPIVVLQALVALTFALHPLAAANPLLGGPPVAARVLSLGWGEGAGAAARRLNQLPGADQLTVAAISVPSFAPLFDGRTLPLDRASLSDYVVAADRATAIYTNTVPFEQAAYLAGRVGPDDLILLDADAPLLRHYTGPGAVASVAALPDLPAVAARVAELSGGRSTLWLVADPAASSITAAHLRQAVGSVAKPVSTAVVASTTITRFSNLHPPTSNPQSQIATFNGQLTLVDVLLPAAPVAAAFPVHLRWQAPAPTPTDLRASLYLRDSAGHPWAEVGQLVLSAVDFPTSAWASGEWADDVLSLGLPERIPPSPYAVALVVTDGAGAQLGAWDAGEVFRGVRVSLGDVEIGPPAVPVGPPPCAQGRVLDADLFLACLPELDAQAVPSGDTFTLALTWSAAAPPQADYRVRYRLLDGAGSVALEHIVPLSPYATSRWRAGDSFEARYDLRLDPALPAAAYTLALNVIAPDGGSLWAADEPLVTVEILPRDRLFELPDDIGHPLDLTLGEVVHLRGFDLDRTQAAPGDVLPLTLYWQGDGLTDLDYTVFVHLLGPDGRPHGQVDRFPGAGSAPTTSWAPGQVIVDALSLPVAGDAPAGDYHIVVGLYDAVTGGRLPVTDGSGNLLPDDRVVLPIEVTVAGGNQ